MVSRLPPQASGQLNPNLASSGLKHPCRCSRHPLSLRVYRSASGETYWDSILNRSRHTFIMLSIRLLMRPLRKGAQRLQPHMPKRTQSSSTMPQYNIPPLRIIGPTIWCVTAAGTVFLGCASWEVYHEAQSAKRRSRWGGSSSTVTYDQLEGGRSHNWSPYRQPTSILSDLSSGGWGRLQDTDKMISGAIGLNAAIFGLTRILPSLQLYFAHIPAVSPNYALLTSTFGHTGMLHLGANMYGLYNFAPQVARSPVFNQSGAHLTAFYLSAGIFANLAQHLTSKWASPRALHSSFLIPSLGASGAIFAILGAWGMLYPDAQLGLLFIPGSVPVEYAMVGIAAFETYGLVRGFRSINFGHAAHLAGLAIGLGYVHFNGNRRLWQPTRRFAFKRMRSLGLV